MLIFKAILKAKAIFSAHFSAARNQVNSKIYWLCQQLIYLSISSKIDIKSSSKLAL